MVLRLQIYTNYTKPTFQIHIFFISNLQKVILTSIYPSQNAKREHKTPNAWREKVRVFSHGRFLLKCTAVCLCAVCGRSRHSLWTG